MLRARRKDAPVVRQLCGYMLVHGEMQDRGGSEVFPHCFRNTIAAGDVALVSAGLALGCRTCSNATLLAAVALGNYP